MTTECTCHLGAWEDRPTCRDDICQHKNIIVSDKEWRDVAKNVGEE